MFGKILLLITLPLLLLAPIKGSQFSEDVKALKKAITPSLVVYEETTYENTVVEPQIVAQEPVEEEPIVETSTVVETSATQTEPEVTAQIIEMTSTVIELKFGEDNYLEFDFDESRDGYVLISGSQCVGELYVPDYVEEKPVVEIGAYAFSGNNQLTGSLYLPSTIKKIGESAFSGCSGLSGILVLPSSLEEIGQYAFEGVTLSGDIVLPSTLCSVGEGAFMNASFDGCVYLNDGLKTIGNYAFAENTKLSGDVIVPASVESYGSDVFTNCVNLNGIYHVSAQGYLVEEGDL